jgi:hypothetical protein
MYSSERQISMAVSMDRFGFDYQLIFKAVILDTQHERKEYRIEKYLEELEQNKQTTHHDTSSHIHKSE